MVIFEGVCAAGREIERQQGDETHLKVKELA